MPADPATFHRLRQRIARLERAGSISGRTMAGRAPGDARDNPVLTFGLTAIDGHLPDGGLPADGVHEILDGDTAPAGIPAAGIPTGGAATAFAAALAGRRQHDHGGPAPGPVVWIAPRHGQHESLYRHGLAAFGLDPDALLIVRIPGNGRTAATHTLWAFEEALRERTVAMACAEIGTLGLTASRRLQLAAAAGGTTGLLLRGSAAATLPTASVTRWRIAAAPAADIDIPRWRVELLRVRNGRPRHWLLEWRHEPDTPAPASSGYAAPTRPGHSPAAGFAVASPLCDRPDRPPQPALPDDSARQAA